MARIDPGSRAHIRALQVETLRAQHEAAREARLRRAALGPLAVLPADDPAHNRAAQRAEALRRASHWLDTALAFTPRNEAGK